MTIVTVTGNNSDNNSITNRKTVFYIFKQNLFHTSLLQVLFLTGLTFIIGLRRSAGFFFQRQKLRGSTFFLGGVALVLFRWPIIGMAVESYGFVLLFRSFFPVACGFILSLVNIPYLNVVRATILLFSTVTVTKPDSSL
uniref:Golgi transport 1A n=1 Tax=Oncorhynchus mykiss TaxID=8022 RepID=A0A8C7U8T7_ONCMY